VRPSRTGPSPPGSERRGAPSWPRSIPAAWSSSTRARDRHPDHPHACTGASRHPGRRPGALGPLAAAHRDRRARPRRPVRLHEHRGRDQHAGLPSLCRAGVLAPALLRDRPNAIFVMDNLAAHKAEAVRKALAAAGIAYRHLPAHSPDLNPSSPAGPSPKPGCAPGPPGPWPRSRPSSARRSPLAPATTRTAGFALAATPSQLTRNPL
jgi:hypothetical protein